MIKVKICGITNLEDALASIAAGCDALGFVFYKKSPRYIMPSKARAIIKVLPKDILKIGVFVNEKEKEIKRVAKLCGFDLLQFHGEESPEFCSKFSGFKIIKAFRVGGGRDLSNISKYKSFAYLFDTFSKSEIGGTGKEFDWKLVRHFGNIKRPIFLSGGLNKENVLKAIQTVRPQWVDACTCVEARPGKKDYKKIRDFIQQAKQNGGKR